MRDCGSGVVRNGTRMIDIADQCVDNRRNEQPIPGDARLRVGRGKRDPSREAPAAVGHRVAVRKPSIAAGGSVLDLAREAVMLCESIELEQEEETR